MLLQRPWEWTFARYVEFAILLFLYMYNDLTDTESQLDGVHEATTDRFYIIELNDSACGFVERHTAEDMVHVRDLVLATARRVLLNSISNGPVKMPGK